LTQDGGGVNANLSLSQGITSSSQNGTFGQTNLGFDLSSETRIANLGLRAGVGLEQQFDDGFNTDVTDPSLRLSYGTQSRQSAFELGMVYNRSDVDTLVELDEELPGILVLDEGTRENVRVSLGYTFGRDARFGGTLGTNYNSLAYSDTTDPDLLGSDRVQANLGLRFEITPRIAATMGYDFSDTDRANAGQDERSTRFRLGADLTVSETLSAGLSVGLREVTTTNSGVTTQDDRFTYALDLRQNRPNGALTLNLNSDLSESGRRTNLRFGTSYETRRGGEFSARAGLSQGDNGDINPLYEVSYSDALPRSTYSISLNQSFSANDLGQEALNSRLRLRYDYSLTATTRLQSSISYQVTDILGLDTDTSRFDVRLGLSRDLSETWAVSSRYTYSVQSEDGQPDDTDNRIFLGLETNFGWRP
jgi:opacity protein-like surface antigen